MIPGTPTAPSSSSAPGVYLHEQDDTTAQQRACSTLLRLDTTQTKEIVAVLDAFLAAFKDIRTGVIPFLDELAEAWKRLDSTATGIPEEDKRRVLDEIIQKYNAESTLAMNMLLKNSQAFFTASLAAIAVGEGHFREQASQHALDIERLEAAIAAQEKQQQILEKASAQALEQDRQASNLRREQLKTKITDFINAPTSFLSKPDYKTFLESIVKNDLNP